MEKDQFEYLQSLLLRTFEASREVLLEDLQQAEPLATPEQIQAEIAAEYALAALAGKPDELQAAVGLIVAQGIFPAEDQIDTQAFFVGMLNVVRGHDREQANECAGRIMLILSDCYRQMTEPDLSANGPAFN